MSRAIALIVMRGLVPRIHEFCQYEKSMDGRDRPLAKLGPGPAMTTYRIILPEGILLYGKYPRSRQ
jgi:hypothetical protein